MHRQFPRQDGPFVAMSAWMTAGFVSVVALGAAAMAAAQSPAPITAEELSHDVAAYDAFGIKQTGGPGNMAVADWVARRLRASGYNVAQRPFDHATYQITDSRVVIDGQSIDSFPLHPPTFTNWTNVIGPLVGWDGRADPQDAQGKVALVLLPNQRHSSVKYSLKDIDLASAAKAGFVGVVAVTRGPTGDLIALNADGERNIPPIPVVLVAGRVAAMLQDAASRGSSAGIIVAGRVLPVGSARNVIAQRVRGPNWIVISTPLSGWFHATAERGPGIATFLALADRIARSASCDSVALVATSGHESGYGGMAAAIDTGWLPRPEATRLWVHLGAGLAAFDASGTIAEPARYMLAMPAAIDAARSALFGVAGYDSPHPVDRTTALGETEIVIARGYPRVVGSVSAHLYHHSRRDRTDRTSGELIQPVAQGFERMILAEMGQTICR